VAGLLTGLVFNADLSYPLFAAWLDARLHGWSTGAIPSTAFSGSPLLWQCPGIGGGSWPGCGADPYNPVPVLWPWGAAARAGRDIISCLWAQLPAGLARPVALPDQAHQTSESA